MVVDDVWLVLLPVFLPPCLRQRRYSDSFTHTNHMRASRISENKCLVVLAPCLARFRTVSSETGSHHGPSCSRGSRYGSKC